MIPILIPILIVVFQMVSSEVSRYYTTLQACSCKDWRYRRKATGCKHMRELAAALDIIERYKAKWVGER